MMHLIYIYKYYTQIDEKRTERKQKKNKHTETEEIEEKRCKSLHKTYEELVKKSDEYK